MSINVDISGGYLSVRSESAFAIRRSVLTRVSLLAFSDIFFIISPEPISPKTSLASFSGESSFSSIRRAAPRFCMYSAFLYW